VVLASERGEKDEKVTGWVFYHRERGGTEWFLGGVSHKATKPQRKEKKKKKV
jgi:hypothetical protein